MRIPTRNVLAKPDASAIAVFALALLVLRIANAFSRAPDSDEPQHLHVVWAWTQGLLPYRDVFDNHAPLFQWLCAPLLALIGERTDVVAWMRLAMIPLYAGALLATWRIGCRLWSPRVGVLAAALVAVTPLFFNESTQFRTDDLWMLAWLWAIAVAVGGPFDRGRAFRTGLLAGLAFAVSVKTVLLVSTALAAVAGVAVMRHCADPAFSTRAAWRLRRDSAAALLAGAMALPALIALALAASGAGDAAFYCVFRHNLVSGLGHWGHGSSHPALLPLGYVLGLARCWAARDRRDPRRWALRCAVGLSAATYLLAFYCVWPLQTHQDLLPVLPLAALLPAAWWLREGQGPRGERRVRVAAAVVGALMLALGVQIAAHPRGLLKWDDQLGRVLALSSADEYVMDAKGETIFRRRPVYWALEDITTARIANGSIADDIAGRLAATGTPLVVDDHLPAVDRAFVLANYLPLGGRLYVAGQHLAPVDAGLPIRFHVGVAADYRIVSESGAVEGTLDGQALSGARHLDIGDHQFLPLGAASLALVWAPAIARGVRPQSLFVSSHAAGHAPVPASA